MKNLIYAENKRIWKHPLTILTLVLAFLAAVFNVNNSTKQYLSEHTFNEEMNLYYLDAKKIDIEKSSWWEIGSNSIGILLLRYLKFCRTIRS